MIIPCIDLMGGKVVQLVQGREKALEEDSALAVLERFSAFPEIQIIDLDAAIGKGVNDELVRLLASRAVTRIGGGVRSVERARDLLIRARIASSSAHRRSTPTESTHRSSKGSRTPLEATASLSPSTRRKDISSSAGGGRRLGLQRKRSFAHSSHTAAGFSARMSIRKA